MAALDVIAAPHRGAPMAINSIGQLGAALVRLPGKVISNIGTSTIEMAEDAAGVKKTFVPNVVTGLSPKSPLLISMNEVPMQTKFHSIVVQQVGCFRGTRRSVRMEKPYDSPFFSRCPPNPNRIAERSLS